MLENVLVDNLTPEREIAILKVVESRYNRVVVLARETLCMCNSARNPSDVGREIVGLLLEGDRPAPGEEPAMAVETRGHHCVVHSPTVSTRPWLAGGES
jgi:hypothetical protein